MLQPLQISYKTTKNANLTDKHTAFSQIDTIQDKYKTFPSNH